MNDYRLIQKGGKPLVPEDVALIHKRHRQHIVEQVRGERRVVVMSHHAPSKKSIHPRYGSDVLLNCSYSSNLDSFITENPQIKLWVHGHTHHSFDYRVGECRVVCNPRGYQGYDLNPQFNPALKLEIA